MPSRASLFHAISIDEYLAGEDASGERHEFVDGRVYCMAGGTIAHATIQGNAFAAFHAGLRGQPCRPFVADMRLRIQSSSRTRFYYPDVSIVCESNPRGDLFQDRPVVVFEVLSQSTRRIDDGEKREAYLSIPSLRAYLLAEQDTPAVKVYRRTASGVAIEAYADLACVIDLPEVGVRLALADLYEGVDFSPEAGDPADYFAPES